MSIRTKIIGSFLTILFLFGGVSVYSYLRSRESNSSLALVNELFLPLSRVVVRLQGNAQTLADDMRRYNFMPEPDSDSSAFSRMARDLYPYLIKKKFEVAESVLQKSEALRAKALTAEFSVLLSESKTLFEKMLASRGREDFEKNYSQVRSQLKRISHRLDEECQRITLAAQTEGGENLFYSLLLALAIAIFGAFTVLLLHRILQPLAQLIESIRKISGGDFHQSLKVKANDRDEIALLAREYNRMLEALEERDRKILDQQKGLLQSERLAAIGQLSAEVVHEIRNPLNSISLNIDWLANELQAMDDEVKKTVRSIAKEVERLNLITESYLIRARVPSQERQRTGLHALLNEILDFSREELKQKKIAVERKLKDDEIFLEADRAKLKQAFLNVLKNAREAMPNGGTLRVSSEIRDNVVRIRVSDTGYGMNEPTRGRTFQPFYTTKPNGTGLGLTLTKTIVEEARGSIECESKVGQGTTFTFQFPV